MSINPLAASLNLMWEQGSAWREARGEGWEWGLVPLTCLPHQRHPKLL